MGMQGKKSMGKLKKQLSGSLAVWIISAMLSGLSAPAAMAAEPGTYLVTMTPSYRDPETGDIEDPGNNEAIGQGMTEKLCGPVGLLEVDASGNTYLTVRYYLSQFIRDVSFEERSSGSYSDLSYEEVKTAEPVEGATDLNDKYGYTDYRMKINGIDSVFRGKAYIEPMGRSVVYFFTASDPVAGSGDFVTGTQAEETEPENANQAVTETEAENTSDSPREESFQADDAGNQDRKGEGQKEEAFETHKITGGGNADDPVTGIPQKPQVKTTQSTEAVQYHLETSYDLSAVPLKEARKLTDPILEKAVGITKMTGTSQSEASEASKEEAGADMNKNITRILLLVSAVLGARFIFSVIFKKARAGKRDMGSLLQEPHEPEQPDGDGEKEDEEKKI